MNSSSSATKAPEIIAVASGKGGTGKTLLGACLGYALIRAGHRVLLIDADPGTDGLSLFILGPKGMQWISSFEATSTFRGVLSQFASTGEIAFTPKRIERSGTGDHEASYTMLISGKGLYGEVPVDPVGSVVPDLNRETFRAAICALFNRLRASAEFDFVIVDTRGGFAFESTDVCAAADSFVLVTDPDYTSFHQDRNLVAQISGAAKALGTRTMLRAILVNRAIDGDEKSFRLELEKEFPIKYSNTFAIPLDLEALKAYRVQQMPYVKAPAAPFSYATLTAFSDILQVVTAQWDQDRVAGWNALVGNVSRAIEQRNEESRLAAQRVEAEAVTVAALRFRFRALLVGTSISVIALLATVAVGVFAIRSPASAVSVPAVAMTAASPPSETSVEVIPPPAELTPPVPPATAVSNASGTQKGSAAPPALPGSSSPSPQFPQAQTGDPLVRLDALDWAEAANAISPRGSYAVSPGNKTANGQQVYKFSVWLEMNSSVARLVRSVSYHFNHPTFIRNDFVSSAGPTFVVGYEGWGCVSSVQATLSLLSGEKRQIEFDQCAVTQPVPSTTQPARATAPMRTSL